MSTAPDELRGLRLAGLVETAARFRSGDACDPVQATKTALRSIARRHRRLTVELDDLDAISHLCGSSPIPASSGRTDRHRLNRGGDRAANAALYRIVLCRLRWDPRTRHYVERRTKDGLSKAEVIRCLKRYVAREIYRELTRLPA